MESNNRIHYHSAPEDKIALFRSLFRGREDVYPRRFESRRTGKTGYSPVCANEWVKGICEKPKIKCAECQHRRFLPVTDDVIRCHLSGQDGNGWDFTMGVYPMLLDETCFFIAADFDKATWQDDARAFLETCRVLNVPAALERSRSGNGGHIWIFFDCPLPAITARKLGCVILTRTMDRRHQLGLDSYDRLFPNQDTMPRGGLGNLIALPLQFTPRKSGNSVFIDANFNPYPDQWLFLSTIRRMPGGAAGEIIAEAQRKGDLIGVRTSIAGDEDAQDPWTLPPSRKRTERPIEGPRPKRVQVVRANLIYVEKKDLPPAMLNRLLRLAAFQNPEFYKAQAMRLATYEKPRVIACGQDFAQHIAVPRGCLTETLALLEAHKIRPEVRDERYAGTAIEAEFQGQLRSFQEDHRARRRYPLRSDSVRKDRRRCMSDRETQSQHSGAGPPAAVARSVAGAAGDVSRSAAEVDR